jgi:ribosomal protein L29
MKKDQKTTITQMNPEELTKRLAELEKEIVETKMQLATQALKNVHYIKKLRKEFAVIQTVLTQKTADKTPEKA